MNRFVFVLVSLAFILFLCFAIASTSEHVNVLKEDTVTESYVMVTGQKLSRNDWVSRICYTDNYDVPHYIYFKTDITIKYMQGDECLWDEGELKIQLKENLIIQRKGCTTILSDYIIQNYW